MKNRRSGRTSRAALHDWQRFDAERKAELDYINNVASGKGRRAPIALRVNPHVDPHTHEYVATGSAESKFGIPIEQVAAIYERAAKMPQIDVVVIVAGY